MRNTFDTQTGDCDAKSDRPMWPRRRLPHVRSLARGSGLRFSCRHHSPITAGETAAALLGAGHISGGIDVCA